MRDASFTLWALHAIGLDWEADDFMQFVADIDRNDDGSLQIMYGIDGERDLTETTLDHLTGYDGAKPVRIGNGAFDQRQNDVYGAVLDSIFLHTKANGYIPERLWPVITDQAGGASRSGGARPGDLGGARRAQALRLLQAHVLGGDGPRRSAGHLARRARDGARAGASGRARSRRTSSSTASTGEACSASTTRPMRWTPRRCSSRSSLPAVRRRARARDGAGDRRRAERARARPALPDRGDRRRPARAGGYVPICSFWMVSALSEIGERRGRARCARSCSRSAPRSRSSPRSWTPTAAATWGTSRRRSPIWRSSTPCCT